MKKIKTEWVIGVCLFLAAILVGCGRLEAMKDLATTPAPVIVGKETAEDTQPEAPSEPETEQLVIELPPARKPVRVKGVYISAYVAGTPQMVDDLIAKMEQTEANALVIDLKDDYGRVVCDMESPLIDELGSEKIYINDIAGLMQKLEEKDVYAIARIPAFRDAWIGQVKPEWCVKKSDGTLFRDRDDNTWIDPYCREAWDYLIEIALEAKRLGFSEVQFDYVRFCTERAMQDAVFDPEQLQQYSRTDIILEFMEYAYGRLSEAGLFVSADVFGSIINSGVNADSVGQIYGEMAKHLDYISPMIYPSHYADGNYGIDHPDMHPYETIRAALEDSRKELYYASQDGSHIAVVRPWLQDFTAGWLANHITYEGPQIRAQIQAVYDSGYDEWLLWDASCRYAWEGLLTPQEAEGEETRIRESRAALPETTYAAQTEAEEPTAAAEISAQETLPEADGQQ